MTKISHTYNKVATKYKSEHIEQVHLFSWIKRNAVKHPEMGLIFAVPNGGLRDKVTAAKMVAEGVNAGIPDIMIPIARDGYHGAFIELKSRRPGARLSKAQKDKMSRLTEQGYKCVVCSGSDEAITFIKQYLTLT